MSKLKVLFWIDRPFALLRAKKYRHYRSQAFGPAMRGLDWLRSKTQRDAARARWNKRPKFAKRLLRLWCNLRNDAIAVWRRDTVAFEIGRPFTMGGRIWICTDVGTRTICAVLLDDLARSGDAGPPYSVAEQVLDRYDMDGCEPAAVQHVRSPIGSRAGRAR